MSSQIMKNNAQKWLFCSMKLYALKLFSNKGGKLSCFFFSWKFFSRIANVISLVSLCFIGLFCWLHTCSLSANTSSILWRFIHSVSFISNTANSQPVSDLGFLIVVACDRCYISKKSLWLLLSFKKSNPSCCLWQAIVWYYNLN